MATSSWFARNARTFKQLAAVVALTWSSGAFASAYIQTNLVANDAGYCPTVMVDPEIKNAWGIAIRPAGFGGHFWVTANGAGTSIEYVGDVNDTPLYQDDLKVITTPGPNGTSGTPTGTVFNASNNFVVTQNHPNGPITAPAKFLFATDGGVISAWTERKRVDGTFDRPLESTIVVDGSAIGAMYFGIGIHPAGERLYAADFGVNPRLMVFDGNYNEIANAGFNNPFATAGMAKPGDYVPFNVQVLGTAGAERVFVAYAKSQPDPEDASKFFAGEEDAGRGKGRLAEFDLHGNLIAVWDDNGLLNAPWGLAIAPDDFGRFSNHLLVSNFGDGTVVALDPRTRKSVDYLRDPFRHPVRVEGIWGLQFGNGVSLGEANHVYFAAGPAEEEDGLFGKFAPASRDHHDHQLREWYRQHRVCVKQGPDGKELRTCTVNPTCNKLDVWNPQQDRAGKKRGSHRSRVGR